MDLIGKVYIHKNSSLIGIVLYQFFPSYHYTSNVQLYISKLTLEDYIEITK